MDSDHSGDRRSRRTNRDGLVSPIVGRRRAKLIGAQKWEAAHTKPWDRMWFIRAAAADITFSNSAPGSPSGDAG